MNNQPILSFFIYMYNRWNLDESVEIFGKQLGAHIFNKWEYAGQDIGLFFIDLDEECQLKLQERAFSMYNGRQLI